MSELTINETPLEDGIVLLTLVGVINGDTFEHLDNHLNALIEGNAQGIVTDLSQVSQISSAGASILTATSETMRHNRTRLVLLNPTNAITNILDLLGLINTNDRADLLDVAHSLDEAKALVLR